MKDIVEATKSGDKRETLIAMRDLLAQQLKDCTSGRDAAALSRRLIDVIGILEEEEREYAKKQAPKSKHDMIKAKHGEA